MNLKFYPNGCAILIENKLRVLVVADTHFGIETDLHQQGFHFKSETKTRLSILTSIIEESNPDYLVVLGDFKHKIPYVTFQEKKEIPYILNVIRNLCELRVLPGNHDIGIEKYLTDDELLPVTGTIIDGYGYIHGHTFPNKQLAGKLIFCGHIHPIINIYDEVGCSLKGMPCYLLAEIDNTMVHLPQSDNPTRVLLVPAFYGYVGGVDVRNISNSRKSPISKAIKMDTAEIFLNDGTYIDSLSHLSPTQTPPE